MVQDVLCVFWRECETQRKHQALLSFPMRGRGEVSNEGWLCWNRCFAFVNRPTGGEGRQDGPSCEGTSDVGIQQYCVHDREDRSVGADAKGQRDHRDRGEPWALA